MNHTLYQQFDHIIVLDTETTGIAHKTDEIIELALLHLNCTAQPAQTEEESDVLIRLSPGRSVPPFIARLTGIDDAMLHAEGVSKEAACQILSRMLSHSNTLLVAYNAQFDLCFLYYFLHRCGMAWKLKGVKMLDAMTVYKDRREYPHKLENAIEAYGLNGQNTHRAIDDARATLELLDAMAQEEDDLLRYVNLFGYNPKYGVSGPRISSVTYRPQGFYPSKKLYEIF